tara:strand:+ start:84 stop:605 length:522 start_codon:yes stop_codon:yes gene_type:complete
MANSDFPRLRYSDVIETEALGTALVPATFKVAANAPAAEIDPDCHTTSVNIQGCKQLDIFVDVATNPAGPPTATKLYIKVRFSGKLSPATGTNADWGYIQVDNIASATGISAVQDYMIEIDLLNVNGTASAVVPRRYISRIQQISGRHASAVVWVDAGTATGTVYFMRQGGSM